MRTNPFAAINCVALSIGRFSSLTEMLAYALYKVLDVVQTESGCVYLLDDNGEELTLVVQRGLPPNEPSLLGTSGLIAALMPNVVYAVV